MRTANERQVTELELSEHELSEIRMLIEERTGICFDKSRERFFVTRVREHLQARGFERGTDFLRAARKTNVEYEALLERLLTQETTFFRYPAVYEAFQKRALPELHIKKVLEESAYAAHLERGVFHRRRALLHRHHHCRCLVVRRCLECGNPGHRRRPRCAQTRRNRHLFRAQPFQA